MSQFICLTVWLLAFLSLAYAQSCTNRFGSSNTGQCLGVNECRGAALAPKSGNCANQNHICCVSDPGPVPSVPSGIKLTKSMFMKLVGNSARNEYLYDFVAASMNTAGLLTGSNSAHKISAYLAQLVGETNYLRNLESSVTDDPDNDAYLGNNRPGDGANFMGRGGILLRGRDNYLDANNSRTLNLGFDLIARPEQAAFPSIAFRIASWFWRENAYLILGTGRAQKGDLSRLVDGTFLNFTHLTHALTNNLQALKDRAEFNDLALSELKVTSMKRGQGVDCMIGSERGYAVPICLIDFQKPYCGCEGEVNMRSCPYGLTEDGRCRSSNMIKCCVERCSSSLDFVIAMDSSGSIGASNFRVQKDFVKNLLGGLNLAKNQTQLGLINFNSNPYLLINFLNFTDYNSTATIIDNIVYNGGSTATHRALRMANEDVLQESYGMRPIESGTSRVVMVITDGESDDQQATYREANRIKERGIDIISVGIGNINLEELIGMASSPDDQYFVEDFDKLSIIISGLQKTTCQKPAEIPHQVAIKGSVEKHAYKYYRFNLSDGDFPRDLKRFTVQLDTFAGRSDLFHSFTNENPKSNDDYIDPNEIEAEWEGHFVEKSAVMVRGRAARSADIASANKELTNTVAKEDPLKQSYYQIERPDLGPNDVLYFSVRGLETSNDFEVFVHNKTVNFSLKLTCSSSLISFGIILNVLLLIVVF